jgi:blue copper oxidase
MAKQLLSLLLLVLSSWGMFAQQPLMIPDTLSGNQIQLRLQRGQMPFFNGRPTETMGANGSLLGPTLMLRKHQHVTIKVTNDLGEPTTIHWHGLHVAPQNDGGPHTVINAGETWSPSFEVMDRASTFWYHPHLHEKTHDHVQMGIAGFIYVRDEEESRLSLPRSYGVDDIPLVVQTKAFDTDNQVITAHTSQDSIVMVNGVIKPYWDAPAQWVRLRLLNGASERVFQFGLSNNQPFFMIGADASLLAAPVSMTRLLLAPGERAEILVDLRSLEGQVIQLMNFGSQIPNAHYGAAQPGMGGGQTIPGYDNNPLNGRDFPLLEIRVGTAIHQQVTSPPTTLVGHQPWTPAAAQITRQLVFSSMAMGQGAINGPFVINNQHFDMDVINFRVPFENIEIWELRNQTPIAHPFHIHNVPFYILDINGNPPPPHLRGKKDVVLVPAGNGVVRFITQFVDFFNDTLPYMYHCHMLTHEDDGMMGQFLVLPPCQSISQQPQTQMKAEGETAQFEVGVDPLINATFQWQSNTGFGFQDLQNAGQYTGVQTAVLSVNNLLASNHNQLFRCRVTSSDCDVLTDVVSIQMSNLSADFPVTGSPSFLLYPNPALEFLYLKTDAHSFNITAFNSLGQRVYEGQDGVISVKNWSPGWYFFHIMDKENLSTHMIKVRVK